MIIIIVILVAVIITLIILYLRKPNKSGIGGTCTTTAKCSTGLTCVGGICTCVKPAKPTNLNSSKDGGNITVSWDAVPGADWYDVSVTGQTNTRDSEHKTTSFTFAASPGLYNVTIFAVSSICGVNPSNGATISGINFP